MDITRIKGYLEELENARKTEVRQVNERYAQLKAEFRAQLTKQEKLERLMKIKDFLSSVLTTEYDREKIIRTIANRKSFVSGGGSC